IGLAAGSVLPLLVYERGRLPAGVLTEPRQLMIFGVFLLISVVLALVVSRRLVKYAMTISPLEASRRVSGSEAVQASMTFGPVQPHRTVAFRPSVALMSSVSLYPVITSRSFEDKAIRGARVQLGTDWQVLFNGPDLVDIDRLSGTASSQLAALKPEIAKLVT